MSRSDGSFRRGLLDNTTQQHYGCLARWLVRCAGETPCPVIGINGAQGSGKSTLARFLVDELAQVHGLRAASLSLDDCYLGRASRHLLAREEHPLLATRGVPGTHDAELGHGLLSALKKLGDGESLAMPRFSKADDDRLPEDQWNHAMGPLDLILFEGWCVGTPPQQESELAEPVNALERDEDSDGRWRHYVNQQLAGPYAEWFAMLDALVFLQIPGFEQVAAWRSQQEAETAAEAGSGQGLMSAGQLQRFIQHYERLTRHALSILPSIADVVLQLDSMHAVTRVEYRRKS